MVSLKLRPSGIDVVENADFGVLKCIKNHARLIFVFLPTVTDKNVSQHGAGRPLASRAPKPRKCYRRTGQSTMSLLTQASRMSAFGTKRTWPDTATLLTGP